jgi:hypothetical protein
VIGSLPPSTSPEGKAVEWVDIGLLDDCCATQVVHEAAAGLFSAAQLAKRSAIFVER